MAREPQPAFPSAEIDYQHSAEVNRNVIHCTHPGMTDRALVAAFALAGLMMNPDFTADGPDKIAEIAVEQADALLFRLEGGA